MGNMRRVEITHTLAAASRANLASAAIALLLVPARVLARIDGDIGDILSSSPIVEQAAHSRDGRLLYYTAYTAESDIWLLDISQNQ